MDSQKNHSIEKPYSNNNNNQYILRYKGKPLFEIKLIFSLILERTSLIGIPCLVFFLPLQTSLKNCIVKNGKNCIAPLLLLAFYSNVTYYWPRKQGQMTKLYTVAYLLHICIPNPIKLLFLQLTKCMMCKKDNKHAMTEFKVAGNLIHF